MKTPLLLATSNPGKLREFRGILGSDIPVAGIKDQPFISTFAPEVAELGETYFENSLAKAVGYYARYKTPVLSDDSGIEVDCLNGAPGVHSARFGGLHMPWPDRWRMLYAAIASHPPEKWTCRFRSVLCYYDGKNVPVFFQGICEGRIAPEVRGNKGFGYDPAVFSDELGKTFGEATDEEKAACSHRSRAARAFLDWYRSRS